MRFSYSQVKMYQDNPWKHFCNYVIGLVPPSSEQAERGSDVHYLFEKLATSNPDNCIKFVDEMLEKEEITKNVHMIVRRYLMNYAGIGNGLLAENRLPWKDAKSVEVEKKVITNFNGIDFVGYIDLVVHHEDGSVTLYDYKTLSNKPGVYEYTYGMQGNLYISAMQNLGYKVRQFIFDCMNPKESIPWNGYHFFRIELDTNPMRLDSCVKQFVHIANEILKNPTYINTFNGWNDQLHNDAYRQFMLGPERLYRFLLENGVQVESKLTESTTRGYPCPWFFVLDDENLEHIEEEPKTDGIKVVITEIGNRKNINNWSDDDIKGCYQEDFDYLILMNHNGYRVFNKDYSEISVLDEDQIKSLGLGVHYLESI